MISRHGAARGWRRIVAVVFAVLVLGIVINFAQSKRDLDRLHEQLPEKLAAQSAIQSRYAPSPELLKIVKNPQHACGWAVNGQLFRCKNGQSDCWEISCETELQANPGTRTTVAKWLVDTKTLADTPDAGAQKLFIRNPE